MKVRAVLLAVGLAAVALFSAPSASLAAPVVGCTGAEQCDDANSCTTDSCPAGTCVNDPTPNIGAQCAAATACTLAGTCNAGGGCTIVNQDDDTPCPDSAFCNGAETCQGGVCSPAETLPCADAVGCTLDECNEASDSCSNTAQDVFCDDGLACNGVETCDKGSDCQAGTPIDCDDGVDCTDDTCNEATDLCEHDGNDANCNDLLFCNGVETCDEVADCQDGLAPCTDLIACTTDFCNEALDSCINTASDAACNDGDFCNGEETCDANSGCVDGTSPCNDGVDCTTDVCVEALDTCLPAPNDPLCDDGLFCNGVETCGPSGCLAGTPETCDDGVSCTTDSCNEGTDACDSATVDAACDDGLFCTGVETCTPIGCAVGTAPDCADGFECTTDACNEDNDSCDSSPDHTKCSDNLFCNGAEVCDTSSGCIDNDDPCIDNVACTVDACDEDVDTCSNVATDSLCDDGLYCSGAETCDAQIGCVQGAMPDCNDGVDCTLDGCNDLTESCDHTPDHASCDDGDVCDGAESCDQTEGCEEGEPLVCDDDAFCNGQETCDPIGGCQIPTPPCADQFDCTIDGCDEKTDTCGDKTPDHAVCDDDLFCNGEEVCDANSGCMDGDDPCDDQIVCTNDACTEALDLCTNLPDNGNCDDDDPCTVDLCSANSDCHSTELADFDGDGTCDARDNCPIEDNPDQANADCTDPEFHVSGGCLELGFDPDTDPRRGCCDGGDVCDSCPARLANEDGTLPCNPARSGGTNCTPEAGCNLATDDGCITVSVPPGALTEERSISVTDSIDDEQNLLARDAVLYQIGLRPEGIDFAQAVALSLCWDDRDGDGNADEGICGAGPGLGQTCDDDLDCGVGGECDRPSTTREANLVMKRNAAPFGRNGIFAPPYTCGAHDAAGSESNGCDTAQPDCSDEADEDEGTVAGCCDMQANQWAVRTCGFSEHFLGEFAGDLVPGNGSRQTDCVSEWSVVNPQNQPYRDGTGFPNLNQTCRDGDPLCDHDGAADGKCTFHVGVCFNVLDRRLTDANDNRLCTPTSVDAWNVDVSGEGDSAGALPTQVAALGGGTVDGDSVTFGAALDDAQACTRHVAIEAPLGTSVETLPAGGAAGLVGDPTAGTTILRMAASRTDSTDDPQIGPSTTTSTTILEDGPKCGDSDEDGQVEATDALIALRTAVGTGSCEPVLCDVTVDGKITASDALAILRTAVGQKLEVACGLGALPSDRDRLRLTCTPAPEQTN